MHVAGDLDQVALDRIASFLVDPLLQTGTWEVTRFRRPAYEITLHPGVDRRGRAQHRARPGAHSACRSTRRRRAAVSSSPNVPTPTKRRGHRPCRRQPDRRTVGARHGRDESDEHRRRRRHLGGRSRFAGSTTTARRLGVDRPAAALDLAELRVIRRHFGDAAADPTDVELETLAQTWSEHCAHKTFRAAIDHARRARSVEPLLAQLRDSTERIDAPFVRVGLRRQRRHRRRSRRARRIAVKAETHNHPSAVEPFGGANTGVGGVIRDVLGIAHRPIAVTDILCFGLPDLDPADAARRRRSHPRRIRAAWSTAWPTTATRSACRPSPAPCSTTTGYTANPLVFCGCIGVADDPAAPRGPQPGDRVVVARWPRPAATASAGRRSPVATMDATTGEVAGASVQIGDPIIEKLLIDVLVESPDCSSRRSPTAAPAACRRPSARWPRGSAPTSTSTSCR